MSWLKSWHPVIKQKNYCHELRFHVKSFSTYWDQLDRTLADLMKDGVKVLSLYLDCFGKTSPVWLVLFLATVGLFLCLLWFLCCFHLLPCCLIWQVIPQNLLLLLLSVLHLHLSFGMDWSYPFCWNECVTLCLLSMQFSKQSCAASKHVTSSLVSSWQGNCTFFNQDHKILYFKLLSLHLKCKLWRFPHFVVGFFGDFFVVFGLLVFCGVFCCLFFFLCVWSWRYCHSRFKGLLFSTISLPPFNTLLHTNLSFFFCPFGTNSFLTDFNILVSSHCSFFLVPLFCLWSTDAVLQWLSNTAPFEGLVFSVLSTIVRGLLAFIS